MERIGADDPDIADRVEQHYIEEAMKELMNEMSESDTPRRRAPALIAMLKLAFGIVFAIAVVALAVKVVWLALQSIWGL